MNLREMAEKARAAMVAQQEALERESGRERGRMVQGLLQKVLGVEVAAPNTGEVELDGLRFGSGYDGYRDTLILLRPCRDCGSEMRDPVDGLEKLGDLLTRPPGHSYLSYCAANPPAPAPEERTAKALERIAVALEVLAEDAQARRDKERAEIEARWRGAWDRAVATARQMEDLARRGFGYSYLSDEERDWYSSAYQRAGQAAHQAEAECTDLERTHPWLEPIAAAARRAEAKRFQESLEQSR